MSLYECDRPGCQWRNPDFRYGLADAGASWASHMAGHANDPKPPVVERIYGMCLACRSVEVELIEATGVRDLSSMGEHHAYPTGYGCEVCS